MNTQPARRGDRGRLFERAAGPEDKLQAKLYRQIDKAMPGTASGREYQGRKDKPDLGELTPSAAGGADSDRDADNKPLRGR